MKPEVKRWEVKQGRLTLRVSSTTDVGRGIETRKIEFRQKGRTTRAEIEIDLATGKALTPKYTIAGSVELAVELQEVILRYTDKAIEEHEAVHEG